MSVIERDLQSFEQFVLGRANQDSSDLDLEDYVCLWRAEKERVETLAAIQEGLDDVAAGNVRPAAEVMAELRNRLR